MSYDFHGPWNTTLGHSSPLHPSKDQQGDDRYLNMVNCTGNILAIRTMFLLNIKKNEDFCNVARNYKSMYIQTECTLFFSQNGELRNK